MTASAPLLAYLTFGGILLMIVAYASDRFSIEMVSIATIVGWLVLFWAAPAITGAAAPLSADAILAGLANPALITVLALLVVGQGLFHTDALERPSAALADVGGRHGAVLIVLFGAMVVSAIINDTPVVVMVLPVLSAIAARRAIAAASVLMPLSFAAQLGGMTTLIGTSTNLLVAGVALEAAGIEIGFFDFTVPAVAMALAGFAYIAFVMPRLLTDRGSMAQQVSGEHGKQFIAQIDITEGHKLAGETSRAGLFPSLKDMTVRVVQRGSHAHLPPFDDVTLRPGDKVIVAATRASVTEALSGEQATATAEDDGAAETVADTRNLTVAEAVVAPGSRLIGRMIAHAGLFQDTGAYIIGIERRSRMPRMPLLEIRLEAGDVLLLSGPQPAIEGLRSNRDVLLLEWSARELPRRQYANRALLIFGLFVAYAATGMGPVVLGALAAAVAMIAAGCLNPRQAARALDLRIYLMVGAALAAAAALQATGGATMIADGVAAAVMDRPAWIVLSVLFLVVSLMTNVLSNNATAVLFSPIAIGIAQQTGNDPLPFLVAVMLGASCAFATPMGYQTNLLVMGPGHYRFKDFVIAGTPLVLITWVVFSLVAPWYYL